MASETILIIGLIVIGFAAILYLLLRPKKEDETQKVLLEWLKEMRGSLDQNLGNVQRQLQSQSADLNRRLDNASRVIGGVQKELGTMSEMGKRMKDLQEFLQSPKLRGGVGEKVLTDTLRQILPHDQFATQYSFRDGSIVDAIIKTDQGIIPIDSKFPMENFKKMVRADSEEEKERHRRLFVRDVKKHIDEISKKYILPAEGTINFALMYIPSEAVYYEVAVQNEELDEYAYRRKVTFVSPNTFAYFLKILLLGLQEKKVAESARQILKVLDSIRQESTKFGESLSVLSTHVTHAKSAMDKVSSEYQTFSGRIEAVKLLRAEGDE